MFNRRILFGLIFWFVAMYPMLGSCQPSHKRFLKEIESRDLSELIDSLSLHDKGYFSVVTASSMQPSLVGDPVTKIRAVFNDQRVVRIFEKLQGMDKADAGSLVQRSYASELQKFKRLWMQSGGGILPEYTRHSVHALLFLSSHFCSDDVFDQNCIDWSYWFYINQGEGVNFTKYAAPDTLLLANLHVVKFMQQDHSPDEANENVNKLCKQLDCGQLPQISMHGLVKLTIGQDDAVTQHTITEFPVFYNWGSAIHLTGVDPSDMILQARLVSSARSWTRPPNLVTDWFAASKDRTFEALELCVARKTMVSNQILGPLETKCLPHDVFADCDSFQR